MFGLPPDVEPEFWQVLSPADFILATIFTWGLVFVGAIACGWVLGNCADYFDSHFDSLLQSLIPWLSE